MIKTITIPESVDDSTKLQKLIDTTGNTATTYIFSPDHQIEINCPLKVFNYTTWEGNGCTFTLMDNAPVNPFGVQVGLIGSKYLSGADGLTFRNFTVDGNYKTQKPANKASGSDHGDGYHNQFQFGNMSNPQYDCLMNSTFENLTLCYSYGDGIRVNGGSNLNFKTINGNLLGHDDIHLSSVKNADLSKLVDHNPRANNVVRTRNCTNIDVHDCEVIYGAGYDTGAPFQSECITPNRSSSNIRYFDNVIKGMKGAAFYVVADQPASGLEIFNNLIVKCGQLEAAIKRPGVGGATILGWSDAKFHNNTIVDCKGYGVADTTFAYNSKQKGSIDVYRNIFTGMGEAYTKSTASGTAIAHLTGSQTTFNVYENCLYDNFRDLYNVTNVNGISKDPLFIGSGDYHLKENSPCRISDYQLGCYSDTQKPDIPDDTDESAKVIITGTEDQLNTLIKSLSDNYTMYWKV